MIDVAWAWNHIIAPRVTELCLDARALRGELMWTGLPDVPDGDSGGGSAGRASTAAASSSTCGLPEVQMEIAAIVIGDVELTRQIQPGQLLHESWSSNVDVIGKCWGGVIDSNGPMEHSGKYYNNVNPFALVMRCPTLHRRR